MIAAGRSGTADKGDTALSGIPAAQSDTQLRTDDHPAVKESFGVGQLGALPGDRPPGDRLIGIRDIRQLFSLGRTAAYELTHRDGFPARVPLSSHAYRWWASEVAAFAAALQRADQNSPGRAGRRGQEPALPQETSHLRITGKVRSARSRRIPQ